MFADSAINKQENTVRFLSSKSCTLWNKFPGIPVHPTTGRSPHFLPDSSHWRLVDIHEKRYNRQQ